MGPGAGGPHLNGGEHDIAADAHLFVELHTMDIQTVITEGRGSGRSNDSVATWPGPTPNIRRVGPLHSARRVDNHHAQTKQKPSPGGRKPFCNGICAQTSRFGWGGYQAERVGLTIVVLHTLQVIHDLQSKKRND